MRFESPLIREKGKTSTWGSTLLASVSLTVEGLVFWQLATMATMATMAKSDALLLRPMLTTFFVGYLCLAVISYRYFFAGPMITEILIALCLGLAIAGRESGGWSGSRKASGRVRDRSL